MLSFASPCVSVSSSFVWMKPRSKESFDPLIWGVGAPATFIHAESVSCRWDKAFELKHSHPLRIALFILSLCFHINLCLEFAGVFSEPLLFLACFPIISDFHSSQRIQLLLTKPIKNRFLLFLKDRFQNHVSNFISLFPPLLWQPKFIWQSC